MTHLQKNMHYNSYNCNLLLILTCSLGRTDEIEGCGDSSKLCLIDVSKVTEASTNGNGSSSSEDDPLLVGYLSNLLKIPYKEN